MTAQAAPGHLVGDRDGDQSGRLAVEQPVGPDADRGWLAPRVADDSGGADDEQVAQIAAAHLGDAAQALLAAAGVLPRHHPSQAANWRPDRNALASSTVAANAVAVVTPTPG